MKKFFIWLFAIFFSHSVFSQIIKQDTIHVSEKATKLIKLPIGLSVSFGVTKNIYDKKSAAYFTNHISGEFEAAFYFKDFFIRGGFRPWTVSPQKPLYYDGVELNSFARLNVAKSDISIGYSWNLLAKLNIEPYIGYLNTSFPVINEAELNQSYDIKSAKGITAGITLNKYFKIGPFDYLLFYFNNNINQSNFSNSNKELGNFFYAFSFGVGYKGWLYKKIY